MGKQVSIFSRLLSNEESRKTSPQCVENNVAHGHVLKHNKHRVFVDKCNKYGMLTVKKKRETQGGSSGKTSLKKELLDEKMQVLLGKNVNIF